MQFGSLTLTQWHEELRGMATPPATPTITPPTTPPTPPQLLSPPIPPLPSVPLTWAARVASSRIGVSPSRPLPLPPSRAKPLSSKRGGSPPRRRRPVAKRRVRGLINCGNSCFINVVLQALLACEPFRHLLLEIDIGIEENGLLPKFVRLAREMCERYDDEDGKSVDSDMDEPVLPDWFYDVFPSSLHKGQTGSQEDAEEFLTFVLNGLHEEMIAREEGRMSGNGNGTSNGYNGHTDGQSSGNGSWYSENGRISEDGDWEEVSRKGKSVEIRGEEFRQSGITSIFGGTLRSEVRRARAKPSVTREPFFSLSLDVECGVIRDVDHALGAYFEPEYLEGYTMENSGEGVEARKHVVIESIPKILILHMKRFSYDTRTGELTKVSRMMTFPEILHVPGRVMHSKTSRWGMETGKTYKLCGVVTHVGKTLAGGHYTCDVRWEREDGCVWVSCDDSLVMKTSMQKVLDTQAYLLFYAMIDEDEAKKGNGIRMENEKEIRRNERRRGR